MHFLKGQKEQETYYNIIITSYHKLKHTAKYCEEYAIIKFAVVILDEGHTIKNKYV